MSLSLIVLSLGGVADKCVKITALVKINDKIRMRNLIKPATNFNLNFKYASRTQSQSFQEKSQNVPGNSADRLPGLYRLNHYAI